MRWSGYSLPVATLNRRELAAVVAVIPQALRLSDIDEEGGVGEVISTALDLARLTDGDGDALTASYLDEDSYDQLAAAIALVGTA